METDFEVGHYLKERVIPRAVLFFTGEADDDLSEDELYVDEEDDNDKENLPVAEAGDN